MSYLPAFKIHDCDCGCGGKDVECRKVGKLYYCMNSYRAMKTKQYTQKASLNSRVRSLGKKQVSEGNYFEAERQVLINDLDYVHSRIVRMTAADKSGYANCFTCGKRQHWSMMQLSHFIKRANTLTRWNFKANRCCCKHCNETLDGNLEAFAYKLDEEEAGLSEQLREMAKEPYKWSREELKQLLCDLRPKLRLIESKFNQI